MKVVEIEERDHAIHLQFEIFMQWRENRVKYQNLKDEMSLTALTEGDIYKLWLPRIVYANTDQKENTRLRMEWEWVTGVSVIKEGLFTRSGVEEVDEAEIFEGDCEARQHKGRRQKPLTLLWCRVPPAPLSAGGRGGGDLCPNVTFQQ